MLKKINFKSTFIYLYFHLFANIFEPQLFYITLIVFHFPFISTFFSYQAIKYIFKLHSSLFLMSHSARKLFKFLKAFTFKIFCLTFQLTLFLSLKSVKNEIHLILSLFDTIPVPRSFPSLYVRYLLMYFISLVLKIVE